MNTNPLTTREKEIAECIAWGASQKEVASQLGISRYTVDNILRKIYAKLHIGKINELSAWWFCTNFNISFDLSPLRKSVIALSLLCLFAYTEVMQATLFCRYTVVRRTRTELVRRK